MKVEKLRGEAVRSTHKVDDVVLLSSRDLTQVVGGIGRFEDSDDVPPEICAIHDYYIDDSVG